MFYIFISIICIVVHLMAHNSRIFILKLVCFLSRYSFCFFPLVVLVLVLLVVVLLVLLCQCPVSLLPVFSFSWSEHFFIHFPLNIISLVCQHVVVQPPSLQLFLLVAMIEDEMLD